MHHPCRCSSVMCLWIYHLCEMLHNSNIPHAILHVLPTADEEDPTAAGSILSIPREITWSITIPNGSINNNSNGGPPQNIIRIVKH